MSENPLIYNRLKKNHKKLSKLLKNREFNCYRLYDKDIPEYPFIIDIYHNYAVIYEKGKRLESGNNEQAQKYKAHQTELKSALKNLLAINDNQIIFKIREKQKGKNQYEKISRKNEFFPVFEEDMMFRINVHDYLDTGLFLDHRPLRKIIRHTKDAKTLLNLFSYTGSISVAAAKAGMHVTTIDMSKTYLDWARENFKLNQINPATHEFVHADVLEFCKEPSGKFDIIVLDPPSFSNSKRMDTTFNVQDFHVEMNNSLMPRLNKNGVLYFSNNFRKFKLDPTLSEKYQVEDISLKSIPLEFRDKKIHTCFKIRNP